VRLRASRPQLKRDPLGAHDATVVFTCDLRGSGRVYG